MTQRKKASKIAEGRGWAWCVKLKDGTRVIDPNVYGTRERLLMAHFVPISAGWYPIPVRIVPIQEPRRGKTK